MRLLCAVTPGEKVVVRFGYCPVSNEICENDVVRDVVGFREADVS